MLFYDFVAILALATVFIANFTDLKWRIIPNKLTFPMIVVGVAAYLGYGVYQQDLVFAVKGGLGAGGTFAIGYGMWYIGGWAGGDVKLFTALGALLAGYSAPYLDAPYPFPLTILLNGVICLAPVLFVYVAVKSIQTPGVGKKIVEPVGEAFPGILLTPFAIIGGSVLGLKIGTFFNQGRVFQILLPIIVILLIYQIPLKFEAPVAFALSGYGIYLYRFLAFKYLLFTFAFVVGIRLLISSVKVINRKVLQEEITMEDLKEGMIPAETIYEKNGEVERYEGPGIKEAAKQFFRDPTDFQLKPDFDKVLADSSMAAGVSRYQVGVLRRHVREGGLEDHIRIKKGLPFAPSFGLGVPVAIFYGDIYWWLITALGGAF